MTGVQWLLLAALYTLDVVLTVYFLRKRARKAYARGFLNGFRATMARSK